MRHVRSAFAVAPLLFTLLSTRSAAAQGMTNPDPAGAPPSSKAPSPAPVSPMPSEPLPSPAGPSGPQSGPEPYPPPSTIPPPSPANPAQTPLQAAANAITSLIRPYGTFKPTMIVSAGTLESFAQPNASAETAAGNPVLATLPKDTRLTFELAQTRVGLWVAEKSQARAHLEIDFVDFTKSSPTVASVPRLRIAMVEWEPIEKLVIGMGQDWDLYGPLNPFGTNLVGANFEAGNTGFLRNQLRAVYSTSSVEVGAAIGLQSPNNTFKDAGPELSRVPTFAVRGALISGKSRVGISGIITELRFDPGGAAQRRTGSYGGMLYADVQPAEGIQIKAEAYVGQNLNNIGSLALGFGSASHDIQEAGGFISARDQLSEHHAVYLTAGIAQILNPSDVVPDYTLTPGATPAAAATRAVGTTGPGMRVNMNGRLGYEYRPLKPLAFIVEPFIFRSRHTFVAADVGRFDPMRTAPGVEVGMMYTF